jgi:hypothetical protein
MRGRKIWGFSLLVLTLALGLAGVVQAHKLLVSAVPEADGVLKVQAFFPDGNPAQEVPVTVTPEDGAPPLFGKTDAQGVCRLGRLSPGSYRVVAGDLLGHRAETRVVVPGAAASAPAPAVQITPGAAKTSKAAPPPGEPIPWGNILAGLGFIFGVSAFILVLRLRAELRRHASRN